MAATIEQITQNALALPEESRAKLARRLLQSLDAGVQTTDVEEAWEGEVAVRLARLQDGAANGRAEEDVFRDLR